MNNKNFQRCAYTGKVMFPTKGEAKEVILKSKIQPQFDGRRVKRGMNKRKEKRAYYCPDCTQWHLTSMEFERKNKVKKRMKNNYGHGEL